VIPSSSTSAAANAQVAPEAIKPAVAAPVTTDVIASAGRHSRDSFLLIELSQTLKAKKLKPGDKIKARVSQDVVEHGRIVIATGAKVVGHVTEASIRNERDSASRLGVVFDRILVKGPREIVIQAVVQAVAPPAQRKSRADESSPMAPSLFDNPRQPLESRAARARSGALVPPDATGSSPLPAITKVPFVGAAASRESQAADAANAIRAQTAAGQSLSIGMPLGVTGLKGLGLTPGATASTPGPVMVSNRDNVKLEVGTQILLRVTSASMAPTPGK